MNIRVGGIGLGQHRHRAAGGAPPAAGVISGFLADRDEGTTGDFFVDPVAGSNANPGTLAQPKASIAGVLALGVGVVGGKHIKLRAGVYREQVNLEGFGGSSGARTTMSRYGTEEAIISAAEVMTGWTQCGAGDAPQLGAVLGVVSSPVWKKTVSSSVFAGGDPRAAYFFEAGARMLPCIDWRPNPLYPDQTSVTDQWWTADSTVTSGGLITGYIDASVTSKYTQAQIEAADVLFHYKENVNGRTKVAGFNSGTGVVSITDTTQDYETNPYKDRWALINILPNLKKGQWGYIDHGDGTCTVYVRPRNAANLTTGIEYSARESCFDLGGATSYLEIRGLVLERASSAASSAAAGGYAIVGGGVTKRQNIVIRNNLIRHTYRARRDYAAIWLGNVDDWIVAQNTVIDAVGQFGIFVQGGDWQNAGGMAKRGRLDRNKVIRAENSPFRCYGQELMIGSRNVARACGNSAHANKFNVYSDGHRCLWYANDLRSCSGYATHQRASSQCLLFNDIPVTYGGADGRAIVDQNSSSNATAVDPGTGLPDYDLRKQSPATEQGIDGTSYILNNMTAPFKDALAFTNALTLGNAVENAAVKYTVKNNIVHGAATVDLASLTTGGWKNNLMTSGAVLDASDTTALHTAVYVDAATGNVSIRVDSPSRTAATASIAAELAILAGWFPDFDGFGFDLAGDSYSASAPPMGPYVNPDHAAEFDAVWIEAPAPSGTPLVGGSLTSSGGYYAVSPWATPTYQWQTSADIDAADDDWTDVAGATSASWTPTAGLIGRYARRRNRVGTSDSYTLFETAIASSYPLADPVVLTSGVSAWTGGYTTKQIETASFTASGKPLLIYVAQRNASSADTTLTVTVGTAGRAFGTGTAATFKQRSRRTSVEQQAWLVTPGSGTVTVQVESSLQSGGVAFAVLEVDGATNTGATNATGGTSVSSHTCTVTTTAADSNAFESIAFLDGTKTVTWAGATELFNLSSGSNTSSDVRFSCAWEQAPSAGAYSADATPSASATVAGLGVEVLS
jgi:hypothetical protein